MSIDSNNDKIIIDKQNEVAQKDLNKAEVQNIQEELSSTKKEVKYGETPYRWFFLVAYCLSVFVNQMQ